MTKLIWPEIFLTGKEPEEIKKHRARLWLLCADGLCGWANSIIERRPDNFGRGMAAIGDALDIIPTSPELLMWAQRNPIPETLK